MNILKKVTDFVGGSLFREIKETVMAYKPPKMSEQEALEWEMKLDQALHEKELKVAQILNDSAAELNKRIAEQEGTASDLKTIPYIGGFIIFLRGLQRPAWGYAAMWMDSQWFFGDFTFTDRQEVALIVINVLVLGFLFGERAMQNVLPLLSRYMKDRGLK